MYVRCPDCDRTMNRTMFARGAQVVVDVCRDHGTWFDAGELSKVIRFAMAGGLERAALQQAETTRREARAAQAGSRPSAPMMAVAPDRGGALGDLLERLLNLIWR